MNYQRIFYIQVSVNFFWRYDLQIFMFIWMYACLRIAIFLFLKLPCVPMLWISPAPVSMTYALLDLHSQFCNIKFTFLAISVKFYVYLNNLIVFTRFIFPPAALSLHRRSHRRNVRQPPSYTEKINVAFHECLIHAIQKRTSKKPNLAANFDLRFLIYIGYNVSVADWW